MTNLADLLAHLLRRAALPVLLALLASCGPGTGGTGTGPISFTADLPASSTATGDIASAPVPCSNCTRADLRLEDQRIELRLACARFVFTGPWDPDATELSLAGTLAPATGTAAGSPATLRLQFGSDGSRSGQVVARLFDAAGVPVFAATLQRSERVVAADTCP